ncbi:pitrilysin family protein [Lactobacillus sp. YT155]|uniref:EF-P 5-aminopentanol modification-associated protein YfmF n=1 Tax=Lactobacillus sp. YT155 TaxID=3060955 RepID=UPI00265EFA5C|nr:pitrilysin family protein [Lactobacillus sp. YT155]MDO1605143.1 pitrilysin family protein [Lactobacillus sp. YT155]
MIKQLANGIQVEIIEDNKFNTTRFEIDFFTKIRPQETTTRKLLSNILSHSCKDYPRMVDISRKTMDLYGADLNCRNRQWSNLNNMNFSMEIINGNSEIVAGASLFKDAFELVEKLILTPLVDDEGTEFLPKNFELEKDSLVSNLISMKDNKELASYLQLWKLLFHDQPEFATPVVGDLDEIKQVTNKQIYEHYQKMLKNDAIKITVVGNVNADEILQILENSDLVQLPCENREEIDWQRQVINLQEPKQLVEEQKVNQSRLALGYEIDSLNFKNNIAYQLFNLALGGDDQSLLFQEVREKYSLAYSINSQYNAFSNIITIHVGTQKEALKQVQTLTDEQIKKLQDNQISDETFEHIKKVLITRRKLANDRITSKLNRSVWKYLKPQNVIDDDQYLELVQQVSKQDIQAVAQHMRQVASYTLIGE